MRRIVHRAPSLRRATHRNAVRTITIVFVEENDELKSQIGSSLDRWNVHHPSGPNDALELVESLGGVDVLITDMDMEAMGGASVSPLRDARRSLIGQADRLPGPPDVFQRLMGMIGSDDWIVAGVAEPIGEDVALTAEMMKLVNSTFFGFFGEIASVERAVSLPGVDLVRATACRFPPDADSESRPGDRCQDERCRAPGRCSGVSTTTAWP